MKIATILGSPRLKGNTDKVLSMFEDKVKEDHDVERINIVQHTVNGCLGCYKCYEEPDEPGCVQKDDALIIFDKMIAADAIVYASPLYFASFTSQMKALIDRHICIQTGYKRRSHSSLLQGKRAALLMTLNGPVEEWCDAIQFIFNIVVGLAKLRHVGDFFLPDCWTPDTVGDKGPGLARDLARAITE